MTTVNPQVRPANLNPQPRAVSPMGLGGLNNYGASNVTPAFGLSRPGQTAPVFVNPTPNMPRHGSSRILYNASINNPTYSYGHLSYPQLGYNSLPVSGVSGHYANYGLPYGNIYPYSYGLGGQYVYPGQYGYSGQYVYPGQYGYSGQYGQVKGYSEPRESERTVTYHPYTRYYTDYEERVTRVPVQKVRTSYYQKIFETTFVPKPVEEQVIEYKPVQKTHVKVQYVPVQRKIIHLPKDEKLYQIANPEKHPELFKRLQEEKSKNGQTVEINKETQFNMVSELFKGKEERGFGGKQKDNKVRGNFRESEVEQVYASNSKGEKEAYNIKIN